MGSESIAHEAVGWMGYWVIVGQLIRQNVSPETQGRLFSAE